MPDTTGAKPWVKQFPGAGLRAADDEPQDKAYRSRSGREPRQSPEDILRKTVEDAADPAPRKAGTPGRSPRETASAMMSPDGMRDMLSRVGVRHATVYRVMVEVWDNYSGRAYEAGSYPTEEETCAAVNRAVDALKLEFMYEHEYDKDGWCHVFTLPGVDPHAASIRIWLEITQNVF